MSRQEIHDRITELLELININHNRMVLNESSFALDLAQMRSQLVDLYSCLDQLTLSQHKPITNNPSEAEVPEEPKVQEVVQKEIEIPVVEERVTAPKVEPEPTPEPEPVEKELPKSTPRFKPEPIPEPEPEPTPEVEPEVEITLEEKIIEPVKEVIKEPVVEEVKTSQPVTPTQKRPERKPLPEGDLFEQLRKKKLDSIKKGISIGKRYEIQNALFNNEAETYNIAIEKLDNMNNLEEADTLLANYAREYDWDTESPLVEELMLLLQRRYVE